MKINKNKIYHAVLVLEPAWISFIPRIYNKTSRIIHKSTKDEKCEKQGCQQHLMMLDGCKKNRKGGMNIE